MKTVVYLATKNLYGKLLPELRGEDEMKFSTTYVTDPRTGEIYKAPGCCLSCPFMLRTGIDDEDVVCTVRVRVHKGHNWRIREYMLASSDDIPEYCPLEEVVE